MLKRKLFKNLFKDEKEDKSLHESVRREITEPVELQADDEKCATAADSQVNIAPVEQSKECLENPPETLEEPKQSEAFLREKVAETESLLTQKEAEIENLLAKIHTLEENKKILTKKNKSLADDLGHLRSLTQDKHKEISHLKEKINDLEWQVDEAVRDKEAQMKFPREKMEEKIQTVMMKLHDLEENQDVLHDQNSRVAAELMEVKEHKHKLQEENLELRKTVQGFKDQLSLLQKEEILADSQEMKNPDAEPPGSWFPSAKCLLVGLGVAVGGLLLFSNRQIWKHLMSHTTEHSITENEILQSLVVCL